MYNGSGVGPVVALTELAFGKRFSLCCSLSLKTLRQFSDDIIRCGFWRGVAVLEKLQQIRPKY
jgi:hypothetical protein